MSTNSPESNIHAIEALLLTEPTSVEQALSVNSGLIDIFGLPFGTNSNPGRYWLSLPFGEKFDGPIVREESRIPHKAYYEPLLNPYYVLRSMSVPSPFSSARRKHPLLGIAYPVKNGPFQEERVSGEDPAHSLHFYVRDMDGGDTITTIVARRNAVVSRAGSLMVGISVAA